MTKCHDKQHACILPQKRRKVNCYFTSDNHHYVPRVGVVFDGLYIRATYQETDSEYTRDIPDGGNSGIGRPWAGSSDGTCRLGVGGENERVSGRGTPAENKNNRLQGILGGHFGVVMTKDLTIDDRKVNWPGESVAAYLGQRPGDGENQVVVDAPPGKQVIGFVRGGLLDQAV